MGRVGKGGGGGQEGLRTPSAIQRQKSGMPEEGGERVGQGRSGSREDHEGEMFSMLRIRLDVQRGRRCSPCSRRWHRRGKVEERGKKRKEGMQHPKP